MRRSGKAKFICCAVIAAFCLALLLAIPRSGGQKRDFVYRNGTIALATGIDARIGDAEDIPAILNRIEEYGFKDARKELRLLRVSPSAAGKIYRFEQYYRNFPVFGRQLVVSADNDGKILSVSGNYLSAIDVDPSGAISERDAADRFAELYDAPFSSVSAEIYSIEHVPTLAYCFESDYRGGSRIFIDAFDREPLAVIPLNGDAVGPTETVMREQTDLAGNLVTVPLEREVQTSRYILGDATRNIYLYDAKNKYPYDGNEWQYFFDPYRNETGNFADPAAISAYHTLLKAYDFYADGANIGVSGGWKGADGGHDTVHGNARNNRELTVCAAMHYAQNYNNAAYMETTSEANTREALLVFGDGDGVRYKSFAAGADVIAHEYQHIITRYTADLIYLNASGAINEAVSDVFGALIEGKDMSSDGFWQCGEDLSLTGAPLRDIKNPSESGLPSGITDWRMVDFCYESHYHGGCDNGGVHSNSAIISHIAYRLYAQMPQYFTSGVMGKLWFDTLQRCYPDTDFEAFRLLMEQSAEESGLSAEAQKAVAAAFDAAGIKASRGSHTISLNGTDMTIVGNYGDTFVMPDVENAPEGQETLYWYDSVYGMKYYAGETYPIPAYDMRLFPHNVLKIWNGVKRTDIVGAGTEFDPYLIRSEADLATLAYSINNNIDDFNYKYVRLTKDLDLQNVPWIPIGDSEATSARLFFDGDGHRIFNLNVGASLRGAYYGLFGVFSGRLENLGIESGNTETDAPHLGGFVGLLKGDITDCYNKSNLRNTSSFGASATGGIAGVIWHGTIDRCYNEGQIIGYRAGGIFGDCTSSGARQDGAVVPTLAAFGNNYNTGAVSGVIAGGIAGQSANAFLVNCINTGTISAYRQDSDATAIGGIAGKVNVVSAPIYASRYEAGENAGLLGCKNTGLMDFAAADAYGALAGVLADGQTSGTTHFRKNVFKSQIGLSAYGVFAASADTFVGEAAQESADAAFEGAFDFDSRAYCEDYDNWCVFGKAGIFDGNAEWRFEENRMPVHKKAKYWIDCAADSFDGGNGTKEDPFRIATAEQLARLALIVHPKVAYNCAGQFFVLTADIDLSGKIWVSIGGEYFDVNVRYNNAFCGFFDGQGHSIKNMSAREYAVETTDYRGRIVTQGAVPALFGNVGDLNNLSGVVNLKMENVNVIGRNGAGGLIGTIDGIVTVEKCAVSSGAVIANYIGGGLVGTVEGFNEVRVTNCTNNAAVSAATAGGIAGKVHSRFHNLSTRVDYCINSGDITAFSDFYDEFAGGLIGWVGGETELTNCLNYGNVRTMSALASSGGVLGAVVPVSDRTPDAAVSLRGVKNAGSPLSYGYHGKTGELFGLLRNQKAEDKIIVKIEKCTVGGQQLYATAANANGIGVFDVQEAGNMVNAGGMFTASFDFNRIDYYFDPAYWSDVDAECANDWYESFGNERIQFLFSIVDEQGAELHTEYLRYGCKPSVKNLEKESASLEFEYLPFSVDDRPIFADTIETAVFEKVSREYTVTFYDSDGNVLSSISVPYGAAAPAPTPLKESDAAYQYVFRGWDKPLDRITADTAVTAIFDKILREYTVTFYNSDGAFLMSVSVPYGAAASAPIPVKKSDGEYRYVFRGWSKPIDRITKDTAVTAIYDAVPLEKLPSSDPSPAEESNAWKYGVLGGGCAIIIAACGLTIAVLLRKKRRRLHGKD